MIFNIKNNLFALLMIPAILVLVNCNSSKVEVNSEKKAQNHTKLENAVLFGDEQIEIPYGDLSIAHNFMTDESSELLFDAMDYTYEPDGSLILYLAPDLPKDAPKSNWLPSPKDKNFSLTLRMYVPKREVLDGSYYVPPILNTSTK